MVQEDTSDNGSRATARALAEQALEAGQPLGWFDRLYRLAEAGEASVPWADLVPNPNLIQLYDRVKHYNLGTTAVVVGCGLGDDAQWLTARGFSVTAFDISACAINQCCKRFPGSTARYLREDLFNLPPEWASAFDVVVESYTLQVLPHTMRDEAIRQICRMLAPGGHLLLICRAREETEPVGTMPWPLTRAEVKRILQHGFKELYFEDYIDPSEDSRIRRIRCCLKKRARD